MPAYGAQIPAAIYKGQSISLINSADATAGNVTNTSPVAVAPEPGSASRTLVFVNRTNQAAQIQYIESDPTGSGNSANYVNLTGAVVAASSALAYNLSGGMIRANFGTAPSSGTFVVNS